MSDEGKPFIVNAAFNIPFSLLAVVGNSLILASFARNPSLISPSNVFLISLSLSDLCVGLFVQPLYIVWRFTYHESLSSSHGILVSLVVGLSGVLCSFSLFIVASLSIDRYLALYLHLRYRQIITVRRVSWFLVVLCFSSVLICALTLLFPLYDEFAGGFLALACFVVNAIMYWKIYCVVRRHKRQICTQQRQQQQQLQEQQQQPRMQNAGLLNSLRFRNLSLAMFYVYLILLLCYLPYISLAVIFPVFRGRTSLSIAFEISWTFVYINSSLNPLLYSWRLKEIRLAVKNTLCKPFNK